MRRRRCRARRCPSRRRCKTTLFGPQGQRRAHERDAEHRGQLRLHQGPPRLRGRARAAARLAVRLPALDAHPRAERHAGAGPARLPRRAADGAHRHGAARAKAARSCSSRRTAACARRTTASSSSSKSRRSSCSARASTARRGSCSTVLQGEPPHARAGRGELLGGRRRHGRGAVAARHRAAAVRRAVRSGVPGALRAVRPAVRAVRAAAGDPALQAGLRPADPPQDRPRRDGRARPAPAQPAIRRRDPPLAPRVRTPRHARCATSPAEVTSLARPTRSRRDRDYRAARARAQNDARLSARASRGFPTTSRRLDVGYDDDAPSRCTPHRRSIDRAKRERTSASASSSATATPVGIGHLPPQHAEARQRHLRTHRDAAASTPARARA